MPQQSQLDSTLISAISSEQRMQDTGEEEKKEIPSSAKKTIIPANSPASKRIRKFVAPQFSMAHNKRPDLNVAKGGIKGTTSNVISQPVRQLSRD